jgi:RimJ/RimL family protein N-acetyltransferase
MKLRKNQETDMDLQRSLFEDQLVVLAPIDYEKDAVIESQWTHDASYLRMLKPDIAQPLSPAKVKNGYENIEKSMEEDKNVFYFNIRVRPDERLIGFAQIYSVSWTHDAGMLRLGIGEAHDRRKGYGSPALGLLLRYAFEELNLYRLTALIPEYNQAAQRFFEKAGFVVEVRRRQALHRDGHRCDLLHMGLLRDEWLPGSDQHVD